MTGAVAADRSVTRGPSWSGPSRFERSLRVAAVIDTGAFSGPGRQLVAISHALKPLGVDVHVITFARDGAASRGFRAHLESEGVTHTVIRERGPFDPRVPVRLALAIRDLQPEVVQTHGYKASSYAWLLRHAGASWPWVAFFHGETHENAKIRFYNWLHLRVISRADQVITMTARHAPLVPHSHVGVIHNAVLELPVGTDVEFAAMLGRTAVPRPRLLVVGRLSPEKGVDVMLRALRILLDRGGTAGALVVGDGQERERLVALAASLNLSPAVAFLRTTPDVSAAYRAGDVLVIPSRSEGLPNVLLEALAHDLPVIATDVGAVREVLGESRAGIVVPPESPEAIAAAIPRALALRDDATARHDRQALVARFSLAARARQHVEVYRELLSRQ
jgi:glycosyltransferase involved in cell wall biosynthesis